MAGGSRVIVSTTPTLEGERIVAYVGVVSGEAVMGANVFRDFSAGLRVLVGGQSRAYEKVFRRACDAALREMTDEATARGANAVVGVDLDDELLGGQGSMLIVCASGTAVVLEQVALPVMAGGGRPRRNGGAGERQARSSP